MTPHETPTMRWQLLTRRLEIRARWTAFCTELARRSSTAAGAAGGDEGVNATAGGSWLASAGARPGAPSALASDPAGGGRGPSHSDREAGIPA